MSADASARDRSLLARLAERFVAGPAYSPTDADERTFRVLGLELPLRATTAILVVTLVLLFDFSRTAIPREVQDLGRTAEAARYQGLTRAVLFGLVPLLVVILAFRDRPTRYGLGIGDWRWGVALALIGCAVMTPIVILVGSDPRFAAYYGVESAAPTYVVTTELVDLVPAEFLLRGFLMFTLLRRIGPLGLVVALLPFTFSHLGKPEIELFSTLFGGAVFGWLDWRTRSIWYSALAHVYVQTLILVVAGGARAVV
jgi:membrane protease YdiL (CAAX protease family)